MNEQSRIFDFLYHQLQKFPKQDMLAGKINGKYEPFSTQEVADKVNRLAAALLKLGLSGHDMQVEQQDKIAIISKNRPEWLVLDMACQQAGIVLCPIYPTTNINELEYIFNDAQIKHVFVTGEDILDKVNNIKDKVPSLQRIFSFDHMAGADHWDTLIHHVTQEDRNKAEEVKNSIQHHHCATIIYTSGTTGKPKGVMLSHRNLVSNVLNSVDTFPFHENTAARSLSFLPLNHIFERMVSYIYVYSGISIYYAESMETIGENLKEVKPTLFTTVPRLLEKVYERILGKGMELTGIRRALFFWALETACRIALVMLSTNVSS
ncbi:MAG: hypothetical protein EOO03_14640 [Chitinophagaceae bacterium]|nr:MAG: hypothetical protein EOO03_14640 [Chitinophagaceae bacterium]